MREDGNGKQQLTGSDEEAGWPVWSPDGKKIAFDSDRMGNFDIWVIEVEGP